MASTVGATISLGVTGTDDLKKAEQGLQRVAESAKKAAGATYMANEQLAGTAALSGAVATAAEDEVKATKKRDTGIKSTVKNLHEQNKISTKQLKTANAIIEALEKEGDQAKAASVSYTQLSRANTEVTKTFKGVNLSMQERAEYAAKLIQAYQDETVNIHDVRDNLRQLADDRKKAAREAAQAAKQEQEEAKRRLQEQAKLEHEALKEREREEKAAAAERRRILAEEAREREQVARQAIAESNARSEAAIAKAQLIVGVGAAAITAKAIEAARNFQAITSQLRLITDGSEEATSKLRKQLYDLSLDTSQAVDSTLQVYKGYNDALKDTGITQEELLELTKTTNLAVKASGASAEDAKRGLVQFAQALGAGKLQAEEMASVYETMPVLLDQVAKGLGLNRAQFRALAKEGKITTDDIVKGLKATASETEQMAETMGQNIDGALQNLSTQFEVLIGENDEFSEHIVDTIEWVGENFKGLAVALGLVTAAAVGFKVIQVFQAFSSAGTAAQQMAVQTTAAATATNSATAAVSRFSAAKVAHAAASKIATVAQNAFNAAVNLGRAAIRGFMTTLAATGVGAVAMLAIGGLISILTKFIDKNKEAGDAYQDFAEKVDYEKLSKQEAIATALKKVKELKAQIEAEKVRIESATKLLHEQTGLVEEEIQEKAGQIVALGSEGLYQLSRLSEQNKTAIIEAAKAAESGADESGRKLGEHLDKASGKVGNMQTQVKGLTLQFKGLALAFDTVGKASQTLLRTQSGKIAETAEETKNAAQYRTITVTREGRDEKVKKRAEDHSALIAAPKTLVEGQTALKNYTEALDEHLKVLEKFDVDENGLPKTKTTPKGDGKGGGGKGGKSKAQQELEAQKKAVQDLANEYAKKTREQQAFQKQLSEGGTKTLTEVQKLQLRFADTSDKLSKATAEEKKQLLEKAAILDKENGRTYAQEYLKKITDENKALERQLELQGLTEEEKRKREEEEKLNAELEQVAQALQIDTTQEDWQNDPRLQLIQAQIEKQKELNEVMNDHTLTWDNVLEKLHEIGPQWGDVMNEGRNFINGLFGTISQRLVDGKTSITDYVKTAGKQLVILAAKTLIFQAALWALETIFGGAGKTTARAMDYATSGGQSGGGGGVGGFILKIIGALLGFGTGGGGGGGGGSSGGGRQVSGGGGGGGNVVAMPISGIDAIQGFMTGGYTGDGGKSDIAGIVHRGEYVVNADRVKALGGPDNVAKRVSGSKGEGFGLNVEVHNYAGVNVDVKKQGADKAILTITQTEQVRAIAKQEAVEVMTAQRANA